MKSEAIVQKHDYPAALPLEDNRRVNNSGLPDQLKSGIERLSGYSMGDVKVHYNSDKPAQLNAHAYAQGTDIHLASGQEKHLPHEAWHVVQQKQGRVKPTLQMKAGTPVNDDAGLEKEADVMGRMAAQMRVSPSAATVQGKKEEHSRPLIFEGPSSSFVQRVVSIGLSPGTKVKVVSGEGVGRVGIVVKALSGGYKVSFSAEMPAQLFDYSQLSLSDTAASTSGEKQRLDVGMGVSTSAPPMSSSRKSVEAEAKYEEAAPGPESMRSSVGVSTSAPPMSSSGKSVEAEEEGVALGSGVMLSSMEAASSSPQEGDEPSAWIAKVILQDDWNNHDLVSKIGSVEWDVIKKEWDTLLVGNDKMLKKKMSKFTLLRLRGQPYKGEGDAVTSYAGWPDSVRGEQKGHKWGTETEGGHIAVRLKGTRVRERDDKKSQSSNAQAQGPRKKELEALLVYFKRTPLLQNEKYSLALDNVMSCIEELLRGSSVSLPIEIASAPMAGELTKIEMEVKSRAAVMMREGRSDETWPKLRNNNGKLESVKTKTSSASQGMSGAASSSAGASSDSLLTALDKFNQHFSVESIQNIRMYQKPQHVTVSGDSEDRLLMAVELESTAERLDSGTRGKKALSRQPKTAVEFLRNPTAEEKEVSHLERIAHSIRTTMKGKLKAGVKFADEELNGIILPTTGAPREVGGYTLTTPMTNVFPLIGKSNTEGKEVTVLREDRG